MKKIILSAKKLRVYLINSSGMILSAAGFTALLLGLLIYPDNVKREISEKLSFCTALLIPTLFPFIALTSFAVNSKANLAFAKIFGGFTRYVLRLPASCTTTVIMSFIGGYPAGASGISILLQKGIITKKQGARMLCFCVNPGAGFVISFLGANILKNAKMGIYIFLSVILSGLLIGIVTAFFDKIPAKESAQMTEGTGGALIAAAHDGSKGMLGMLGCIIFFTAITALVDASGISAALINSVSGITGAAPAFINALYALLCEITTGISDAAKFGSPLFLYAFGLAFGGISVHLQVYSFFKEFPIPKPIFILMRLVHGVLAAVMVIFMSPLYREPVDVFSSFGAEAAIVGPLSTTLAGAISLAAMCTAFLIICRNKNEKQ